MTSGSDLNAKMKKEMKREMKLESLTSSLDDAQKQLRFCEEVSQKLMKYKTRQPSM